MYSCSFVVFDKLIYKKKKTLTSSSNAVVLNLGGRGQKFKPLSNKLNTCKEKVCLLKFIIRPFGSFLNLQASRSFYVVERKLLACLLVGLGSPRPCCLFGGWIGFLGVSSLFLDRGYFYLEWVVVFGWLSALGFQRRCGQTRNRQKAISYRGAKTWNQLSSDIKEANSLNSFKCKLKHHLQPTV